MGIAQRIAKENFKFKIKMKATVLISDKGHPIFKSRLVNWKDSIKDTHSNIYLQFS